MITVRLKCHWSNPSVIALFFEHLSPIRSDVLLLPPATVMLIRMLEDPSQLKLILEPLAMEKFDFVLLPVSNSTDPSISLNGSHWSLLLWIRNANLFEHWDSASPCNDRHARAVAAAALPLLSSSGRLSYRIANAPQQKNSYDCGCFVLGFAEHLVKTLGRASSSAEFQLSPAAANEYRERLRGLIEQQLLMS